MSDNKDFKASYRKLLGKRKNTSHVFGDVGKSFRATVCGGGGGVFSEETRNEIHKLILVEENKQLELNKVPGRTSKSWKQYDSATSL